jgi:tetratricopeptide (TPR) repeat protein
MKRFLLLLGPAVLWAQIEDAGAKARRARELAVAGRTEEAIPVFRELAEAHPNDADVLVNLSIVEFKARRFRDAADHAAAAARLRPDSLAANLFLGSSYEELGQHSLALKPLEKVIAMQPQDRNARVMLAQALLNLNRYEEAAAHFQKASDSASADPKVWYGLGRSFEALSENAFQKLEDANPESPYWHALVADQYVTQRRYGSAFFHYRQALKGNVILPGLHAGLATVYRRTGHQDWAEIEEQRERQSVPDCGAGGPACGFAVGRFREVAQSVGSMTSAEARYWVCKSYAELARNSYAQLSQLPPSLQSHLHTAKTYETLGLAHEASVEWREALKLAPGDMPIQAALAESLFRAHEFSAALPILTGLLKTEPRSRELHFLEGACLLNLDEPAKSVSPLEDALRLDDHFLPAHAALGQALLQMGNASQAIPHLKAALAADEDGSTHFRLLRAYQLAGRTELAARAKIDYEAALKAAETKSRLEEGGEIWAP